jgi:hypothetical protein
MGVLAALQQPVVTVEPGGEASVGITLRNTGAVVDQFTVEVLGDAAGWATVEPPSVSLFPGAQGDVRVTFRPPLSSATRAGAVRFGVMVRSKEDPTGSAVEEGTLQVGAFAAPGAELIPRTSHGSRVGRHELAVDNRGNVPIEAALEGIDPDRLVRFDFDPPSLSVPPGVAGFAKVLVKPARQFWRGAPKTRPFKLSVQPNAPGASPVVIDGSFLQESILPAWFVKALLAAAALLIGLILLWVLVLKPEIRSTAAETLQEFGFSPRPGSSAAGGGGGGPGSSPGPAPSGGITITPPPEGGEVPVDGRLHSAVNAVTPTTGTLFITDLVFSNPTGAGGQLTLERTSPDGTTTLLQLRLDNFRDLDFHFVTPIRVQAGETLALIPECTAPAPPAPAVPCDPAVFYSGVLRAP